MARWIRGYSLVTFVFGKFELPPTINALELGQICLNFGQIWLFCAKTIIFFFFSSAAVWAQILEQVFVYSRNVIREVCDVQLH